jgi:FG-GAP-like repeat
MTKSTTGVAGQSRDVTAVRVTVWQRAVRLALAAELLGLVCSVPVRASKETPHGAATNESVPFRHIVIDRDPPTYPHCKTVGDINGDGFVDVLAASAYGQGLYWYAYPNWTKHRIAGGSFTTDMQVGDVDKDGDLDVIIPRVGTGLVWFENPRPQGSPATATWRMHRIDKEGAHDVEVGDIDGDGRLDIVVRYGRTRVFLQNNPDSWRKIPIPTGGRGGTALGDLDNDGDLDIAQNGYWLETPADKSAKWKRHEIAPGWPSDCGVHIVDINGDGRMDVLLAPAETSGRLVWYETTDPKNGPWKEHVIADDVAYIHTFKTADVNRDGELDVVTAEMEQSPQRRVSIYFNEGKALRWRQQVVGRTGSHNLRVADIGNDGDIDIIGANHGNYGGDTPIDLWENLTNAPAPTLSLDRWQRHVIDPHKPWGAAFILAGDLDGDGLRDIVTGGWWYRNPGHPGDAWTRQTIGKPLNDAAVICDFDLDGSLDILGTQGKTPAANANFAWAQNDGKGHFTIHTNLAPASGDFLQGCTTIFTGYRRREIALSWHRGGQGVQMFTVPKNPVAETWPWRKISDVSQDEQVSAGQIDNNTSVDLLLGTKWLRKEGKSWSLFTLNPTSGNPDRNRLADINGDGRLDAVVGFEAINVPGKLAWYEQPKNATDTWTEHVIATVVGPMSLDVADVDRDGDMDVVVGEHNYKDPATAKLHVFENTDGEGKQWKDHIVYTGDEHHDGAIFADMDNDGDLDIISIGWRHSRVLLYENKAITPDTAYTPVNPRKNDLDKNGDRTVSEAEYPDLETHAVLSLHRPGSPVYESLLARLPKR